jgi:PAS domain S-box-containing protein
LDAPGPADAGLPAGGGETGELIRRRDWAATSLGPIESWPQSLKTTLGLILYSPVPIVMLWGEDGVMLYNDAYSVFAGARHPQLLGSKVREGWPEVADFNDHVMKEGLAGRTLAYRDQELTLRRNGFPEQVWMNLDYSPVFDESGRPAGVIAIVVETTQQVLATRALATERDRARNVLENMGDGFMLLDREFRVIEINSEGVALDGRPREEILGRSRWELWPGTYDSEPGRLYRAAMAERRPVEFENHHVFPNGREAHFKVRCYPVAEGLAVFYGDEIDHWRAEQRLMLSEESLRLATEAAEVGTWDLDLTTDTLTWSDRTKAVFGISPGVAVSMADFYAGLHPDDLAATSAAFEAALDPRQRAIYDVEYRTIGREDGVVRWVAAKGKGLFDEAGRCVRALGTAIDITERIEGQERLRLSEAKLRELNATLEERVRERTRERDSAWTRSQDLLAVVSPDGVIAAVNPVWETVLGFAPEDLVGRAYAEFVWPDDLAVAQDAFQVVRERNLLQFDCRFRRKDGGYRWLSWSGAPDETGVVYGSGRDVTAEKEAREALARTEEALRQSQKMEAVGQLTGGIAHDFNNLLTIIRSAADFLRRRDLDEARRERYIDAVAETADRAARLTGQLLAFARRQPLELEVFDAGERVRALGDMIRPLVGAPFRVEIETPPEPLYVEADLAQFETAVVNLAINARDAMGEDGVLKLSARAAERAPAGAEGPAEWVLVEVADTGCGIPASVIPKIFEPFFTTKEVGKGTGLGLSQVFGFAKQAGGEVEVWSQPGEGARFSIFLPPTHKRPDHGPPTPEVRAGPRRRERARVLVVEDNAAVGAFSTQMLQDLGYRTTLAANAAEALSILQTDDLSFDVVFSDVVMPGKSGVEFAKLVRERWPGLPVVLTSGYSHVLAEEGSHGFPLLRKPYSVEAMARVLRRAVGDYAVAPPDADPAS